MPDLSVFFGLLGQLQLGSNPEFFQVLIKTGQCFFPIARINEPMVTSDDIAATVGSTLYSR